MYDQTRNGKLVQELGIGEIYPEHLVTRLFPNKREDTKINKNSDNNNSNYSFISNNNTIVGNMFLQSVQDTTQLLFKLLQDTTSPIYRLRCGCKSKTYRSNESLLMINCKDILLQQLMNSYIRILNYKIFHSIIPATLTTSHHIHSTSTSSNTHTITHNSDVYDDNNDDNSKLVTILPNQLRLYTHYDKAPEETLFMYQEIFVKNIYLQCGITLKSVEHGIIIDAGEKDYNRYLGFLHNLSYIIYIYNS